MIPLVFLGTTSILNVVLDIIFVVYFGWGIGGAAQATVISQAISGLVYPSMCGSRNPYSGSGCSERTGYS